MQNVYELRNTQEHMIVKTPGEFDSLWRHGDSAGFGSDTQLRFLILLL